jgi:hypothetical protein
MDEALVGLNLVGRLPFADSVGLSLVRLVELSRSNLALTSLTSRFSPFTKHHGDIVAAIASS